MSERRAGANGRSQGARREKHGRERRGGVVGGPAGKKLADSGWAANAGVLKLKLGLPRFKIRADAVSGWKHFFYLLN